MTETDPQNSHSFTNMINMNDALNVHEFCKSRIDEILMLAEAVKESPFRGQAFQRLPKHMRRRQMSHFIKRMPRRLRNTSLLSTQDDGSGLPKRPSRKFRRRPGNLLLEYNRRQKNCIWLETHIWHARRFHMTSKWGYRLPENPTNKSFRACYRAITSHCYINDMSYYGVIELCGQENTLLEGVQQCVSTNCGLTFAAKMFKNGSREGYVTIYHPNSYPYAVIGEVSFLWKPTESKDGKRTIWITAHPKIYKEIADAFQTLFSLCEVGKLEESGEVASKNISDCSGCENSEKEYKSNLKSKARKFSDHQIPSFINKDGSVTMRLLKDKLNRFRLIGPLSLAVLSNAFDVITSDLSKKVSHNERVSQKSDKMNKSLNKKRRYHTEFSDSESTDNIKKIKLDEKADNDSNTKNNINSWWDRFYKNDFRKKCLEIQASFYKRLADFLTPSDLPPGMVLSLVVKDPRLTIPPKRTKCTPNIKEKNITSLTSLDPSLCYGPLWETDVLEQISNKISTAEINNARSKLLVPGSDVKNILEDDKQAKVPLIIIQQTSRSAANSSDRHDFASGFDIIVPPGWAMPFWLSLIFRGARPGGLRETKSMTLETKNVWEYIQPDSNAGELENLERYEHLRNIYFKRPPSKRTNFAKIGVQSPFYFPWKSLLNDWRRIKPSAESEDDLKFFVLRDVKKLAELSALLQKAAKQPKDKMGIIDSFQLDDMNCLVPISLESCDKGAPKENAMLCLPTSKDMNEFKNNKICPAENQHSDPHLKTRKSLKLEHAKLLKSLKKKRRNCKITEAEEQRDIRCSQNGQRGKSSENGDRDKILASRDVVYQYNQEMRALWLREPQNIDTVVNSCSRTLLGYVVLGGFSFSQANGTGLGYIALKGLLSLLERSFKEGTPPLILFRNNNFVKYRFAKIYICINKKY